MIEILGKACVTMVNYWQSLEVYLDNRGTWILGYLVIEFEGVNHGDE